LGFTTVGLALTRDVQRRAVGIENVRAPFLRRCPGSCDNLALTPGGRLPLTITNSGFFKMLDLLDQLDNLERLDLGPGRHSDVSMSLPVSWMMTLTRVSPLMTVKSVAILH